jgi:Spy/CpxP family protein refolding chaperone
MSKVKFLTILSSTLAIINLVLIGFFLLGPHHGNNKNAPKEYILKQLDLDEDQVAQYEVLIVAHQKGRIALKEKIMALRNQLYIAALKENDASKKNQVLSELKILHQQLEVLHLEHFEQLKKICRANQLKHFDGLVDELTQLFITKKN